MVFLCTWIPIEKQLLVPKSCLFMNNLWTIYEANVIFESLITSGNPWLSHFFNLQCNAQFFRLADINSELLKMPLLSCPGTHGWPLSCIVLEFWALLGVIAVAWNVICFCNLSSHASSVLETQTCADSERYKQYSERRFCYWLFCRPYTVAIKFHVDIKWVLKYENVKNIKTFLNWLAHLYWNWRIYWFSCSEKNFSLWCVLWDLWELLHVFSSFTNVF